MHYRRVDEHIAAYLRGTGGTQAQLAADLGMCENTLSWKRRGARGRSWRPAELARLAHVVGPDVLALAVEDYRDALAEMAAGKYP